MINIMQITRAHLLLLFLLMMLHSHSCSAVHMASNEAENHAIPRDEIGSRKLLIAVNKGKLRGVMVEPQKAVVNGLRKRPPTSSNPSHNK